MSVLKELKFKDIQQQNKREYLVKIIKPSALQTIDLCEMSCGLFLSASEVMGLYKRKFRNVEGSAPVEGSLCYRTGNIMVFKGRCTREGGPSAEPYCFECYD